MILSVVVGWAGAVGWRRGWGERPDEGFERWSDGV